MYVDELVLFFTVLRTLAVESSTTNYTVIRGRQTDSWTDRQTAVKSMNRQLIEFPLTHTHVSTHIWIHMSKGK